MAVLHMCHASDDSGGVTEKEGDHQAWCTVQITAIGRWQKQVSRGHSVTLYVALLAVAVYI
jgi:hypothetical protein